MRSTELHTAVIQSLSHDGRGIVSLNEKVTFVQNALPTETVRFCITRKHRRYNEAETIEVIDPAPERVTPPCPHANVCGGCSMQHIATDAQIIFQEQTVKNLLKRTGHVEALTWLSPLSGPTEGYRRKARLGVRYVRKKEKLLVGFREKQSNYLAEITTCTVLDPRIGLKLPELAALVRSLECFESLPQIEVAAGDTIVALTFRHMDPLSEQDQALLRQFGEQQGFHIYLQPGSPDTVHKLWPDDGKPWLHYALPAHTLEMRFHPNDFTQVNHTANQQMIAQALALLNLQPTDTVLDLFCGLGNFTLPMARFAASVTGVEGSLEMVKRARENALLNGLTNTRFFTDNLMAPDLSAAWLQQHYDSILLDPPRTGAHEILPLIEQIGAKRIVYISCNPATLARDAGILVNDYHYQLISAGVVNMFPHTGHIETIALFEKSSGKKRKDGHRQTKISSAR